MNIKRKWFRRMYTPSIHLSCVGILLLCGNVQAKFLDVDVTHPNFHAVEMLQKQGIVEGYRVGKDVFYRPLNPVIRAEALKVLMMASDTPTEQTEGHYFPDVPMDEWYTDFVNTAADLEIVQGFADGNFHPSAQVSRSEFLKMLVLSFQVPVEDQQAGEEWYDRFFRITGDFRILDDVNASPYESVSRGEMAELIFRTQWVAENDFSQKYVYSGSGEASYYNEGFAGRNTANGEIYDPTDMTAAHRTLPFGTYVKVTYEDKFVIVRINDRGPYHDKRILDLSQKAFEYLAPISRGVIDVEFEVVSAPSETNPEIPEFIQPSLSSQTQNEPIPEVVAQKLDYYTLGSETKNVFPPQQLFTETVAHLSTTFFPDVTLRRTIPQKMLAGTVIDFSGTVTATGKQKAIVFLQKIENEEKVGSQIHFSGAVSGKNFGFPVFFTEAGTYQIGLVFDDDRRSRVEEIEVVSQNDTRTFPKVDAGLYSNIEASVVPEDKEIILRWTSLKGIISKMMFSQGSKRKILFIEDGLAEISLSYDFFQDFDSGQNISIKVFEALSKESTLADQSSAWELISEKIFLLVPGFPDAESEKISIYSFPRFLKTKDPLVLEGKLLSTGETLASHVAIINPDGEVERFPLQMKGVDQFQTRLQFEEWGTYVVEFLTENGEVLFNRALYVWQEYVLPVFPWSQIEVGADTVPGIRDWVNRLRKIQGISSVTSKAELNTFAQNYAERMARENFISHVTPTGQTFAQRIESAGLQGEFGENLSFGSTFELALSGLENSASHRENLLKSKWTRVGIGITKTSKGYYIAQLFGKE